MRQAWAYCTTLCGTKLRLCGKQKWGIACAGNGPNHSEGAIVPKMKVKINEQLTYALIDIGCTQTLAGPTIRTNQASWRKKIITANRRVINCQGETYATLSMAGKTIKVPCVAIQRMLPGVDIVIGTDVLKHFKFCLDYGKFSIAAAAISNKMSVNNLTITKNYFKVNFDGEKWIVRWNWIKELVLRNCIDFYKMAEAVYPRFKSEVINGWIDNGWLVKTKCNEEDDTLNGYCSRKERQGATSA